MEKCGPTTAKMLAWLLADTFELKSDRTKKRSCNRRVTTQYSTMMICDAVKGVE